MTTLYHFASAQTRGFGSNGRPRSCYSSHPPLQPYHAPLPWPLRAGRLYHRAHLAPLGQPIAMPASPLGSGREANVHVLCPVPWRPGPLHLESPHPRSPDRGGFAASFGPDLLRPDLFRARGARADYPARRGPRPSGAARRLARPEPRRQSPRDRVGAEAGAPASRYGQGPDRGERDAAEGRAGPRARSPPISTRSKTARGYPVTYADVWEFWLKASELSASTDFITIHILPYWEDDPVSDEDAVAHVREVRARLRRPFPARRSDRRGGLAEPGAGCAKARSPPPPTRRVS